MGSELKFSATISDETIVAQISTLISKETGVQLGDKQSAMVLSRLLRRTSELQLDSLQKYFEYFMKNTSSETKSLISLLTTHHTYFFREFAHFTFVENSLPAKIEAARKRGDKKIRIWSAACSRGQEVYSLSMHLHHHLAKIAPDFTYEIIGTDVDSNSISVAHNGVFHRGEIKSVPLHYLADHWARGTGEISEFVKAKKSIRTPLKFETRNLIDPGFEKGLGQFDYIFCRNVFIYFTQDQIKNICKGLLNALYEDGSLIIGLSESLAGLSLPLELVGPSIYSPPNRSMKAKLAEAKSAQPAISIPKILRVLCVDDSNSILALLKRSLTPEFGFQVVGTAGNGLKAAEFLRTNTVDVMTLDIHMPEQDGIGYLKQNHKATHPPVVMVTSVSRENSDLAFQALTHGAMDYVEKPALNNWNERGEEIRIKLRCAFQAAQEGAKQSLKLDSAFKHKLKIANPEKKVRVAAGQLSSREKILQFLKATHADEPGVLVLFESSGATLGRLAQEWTKALGRPVTYTEKITQDLKRGEIVLADASTEIDAVKLSHASHTVSICIFGKISRHLGKSFANWGKNQILLEDVGPRDLDDPLVSRAQDIVPATSFAYMSAEFLGGKA